MIWINSKNDWDSDGLKELFYKDYFSYLSQILPEELIKQLFDKIDYCEIVNYWNHIKNESELDRFTNPFFIGYGNPRAKILFVGHECAYTPAKTPNLFLNECVLRAYP